METMEPNPGPELSSTSKRKAPMEPHVPNKSRPQQTKRTVQIDSASKAPGARQVLIPKSKSAQMQPSPKGQTESSEAVRSKLRDSLTAALALVTEHPLGNTDEEASISNTYYVKDEPLQGNGLSWVSGDTDAAGEGGTCTSVHMETSNEKNKDDRERNVQTPEIVSYKVEAELFKLFGGVNKKYKEKGRSLLFNLKDHNNPELRGRVMSGAITPQRLCAMSAEELASKELSQWRMAKAEEMAQMIVLPNSEANVRRLVKKTHKGEYHVEVEQDSNVSVVQDQLEKKDLGGTPHSLEADGTDSKLDTGSESDGTGHKLKTAPGRSRSRDEDAAGCTIAISPSEGSDLMQGLMADEMKDSEFLPPIVSLDEFMKSLDSEPPFENMAPDAEKLTPTLNNEHSFSGYELKSLETSPAEKSAPEKLDRADVVDLKSVADIDVIDKQTESESVLPGGLPKVDCLWDGVLQLNLSSMASVTGYFRSGEKKLTKEWPSFLEIKGRVKLDAFEKFIQELPLSRNRAIMLMFFAPKEGSPESEKKNLLEVADTYVADERVGFAEPATGVELYFCPPRQRELEMLRKYLPKDYTEALNVTENGLIGLVVWRRKLTSTISPNSYSQQTHASKNRHFTSRRSQEDTNVNPNLTSMPTLPNNSNPQPDNDEDDEIPPGFGPPAAREVDDLPEFNFSGALPAQICPAPGTNLPPCAPSCPVDQMRALVNRYGQIESAMPKNPKGGIVNLLVEPWNEDDDDIPEWRPQAPLPHQVQPHPRPQNFQRPTMRPHMTNQHRPVGPCPSVPFRPPALVHTMRPPGWQQESWWLPAPPHGPQIQGPQHFGVAGFPVGQIPRRNGPPSRGY